MAPVRDLLRHGISVGLGTDGAANAVTLDMFEEIKAAARMQKNQHLDPTAINAYQVLQMATIQGAKALGLNNEIGTIETGKKADIILVDIEKPHLTPQNDICSLLACSANGADVHTTIINGQVVMKNRKMATVDERETIRQARKCVRKIVDLG